MNREDKRGIFFGVVGVLTLIVAIIGATLAYFSINANSAEDALVVQAASVQIVYEDGNGIEVKNIIPSTNAVAMAAYSRWLKNETTTEGVEYQKCIDDNNNVVCGVYEFSLTNNGTNAAKITAKVVQSLDEETGKPINKAGQEIKTQFTNLKYTLYDITDVAVNEDPEAGRVGERISTGSPVQDTSGQTVGTVTYTEFKILPTETELSGSGTTKRYRLFIWLDEAGELNNPEQGAEFSGTVYIDVAGTQNITGVIDGVSEPGEE